MSACVAHVNAEFIARMEDVLALYAEPPDERRPVVCFDETPRQLISPALRPQRSNTWTAAVHGTADLSIGPSGGSYRMNAKGSLKNSLIDFGEADVTATVNSSGEIRFTHPLDPGHARAQVVPPGPARRRSGRHDRGRHHPPGHGRAPWRTRSSSMRPPTTR